jgi:hypothetical protein
MSESEQDNMEAKIDAAIKVAALTAAPFFHLFGWKHSSVEEITQTLREAFRSMTKNPESIGIGFGRFYISCAAQGERPDSEVECVIHLKLSEVCDLPPDFKYNGSKLTGRV